MSEDAMRSELITFELKQASESITSHRHQALPNPISLVTATSSELNQPATFSFQYRHNESLPNQQPITTSTIPFSDNDTNQSGKAKPPFLLSDEHQHRDIPTSPVDIEIDYISHVVCETQQHQWHAFLSRQKHIDEEGIIDSSHLNLEHNETSAHQNSRRKNPTPIDTSELQHLNTSRIDALRNLKKVTLSKTLLSVTAEAIADVIRGVSSPNKVMSTSTEAQLDEMEFDSEVYNSFIRTLVDCAPLVRKDNQTVVTSLLRQTAYILDVPTVTSWYEPNNQLESHLLHEPSNELLTKAVLLFGDGSPQIGKIETKRRWKVEKRRFVHRALSLAARPYSKYVYGRASVKMASDLETKVMLSYTLTLTTAMAAFARMNCQVTIKHYAPGESVFLVAGSYFGVRLSFSVSFKGDAPCMMRFFHPGIIALKSIDKYLKLISDVRELVEMAERKVLLWECSRESDLGSSND